MNYKAVTMRYLCLITIINFKLSGMSPVDFRPTRAEMEADRRAERESKERVEKFLKNRTTKELEILTQLAKISKQKDIQNMLDDLFIEAINIYSSQCVIKALDLGASKIKDALSLIEKYNENCYYSKLIQDEKELIISLLKLQINRGHLSKECLEKIKLLPVLNNIIIDYLAGIEILKIDNSRCVIL